MKIIFITTLSFLFCLNSYSQIDTKSTKQINSDVSKQTEKSSLKMQNSTVIDSTSFYVNRLENIKSHIKAIDTKVDYINSNQEKKEVAEQNGWFKQMYEIKQQLIMEQAKISQKLSVDKTTE